MVKPVYGVKPCPLTRLLSVKKIMKESFANVIDLNSATGASATTESAKLLSLEPSVIWNVRVRLAGPQIILEPVLAQPITLNVWMMR